MLAGIRAGCLLLSLLLPVQGWAAIAFDSSVSTTATASTGGTLAFNNVAGDFLICFVGGGDAVAGDFAATVFTYNGVALTAVPSSSVYDGAWTGIYAYYLIAPATGTHDIVVTHGGLDQTALMCATFSGVHQTTPMGTASTNSATSGTTASVSVTSAAGEMVVGGIASDAEGGITEVGTLILETAAVGGDTIYGLQRYAGSASVSVQWTQASTGWSVSGVSLKPAGAAAAETFGFLKRRAR